MLSTTTNRTQVVLQYADLKVKYTSDNNLQQLLEQFKHWFTSNLLVPGLIMSGNCINMVKATGDGKDIHITHFKRSLNSFVNAFYGRQMVENYCPCTEKWSLLHPPSKESELLQSLM